MACVVSHSSTTSAGLFAARAPMATSGSVAFIVRFHTTRSTPFYNSTPAICLPMIPSPMKPTGMMMRRVAVPLTFSISWSQGKALPFVLPLSRLAPRNRELNNKDPSNFQGEKKLAKLVNPKV